MNYQSVGDKMSAEEQAEHQSVRQNRGMLNKHRRKTESDDDKGDGMPMKENNTERQPIHEVVINEKGEIVSESIRDDLQR